jgi:hypothetical protein
MILVLLGTRTAPVIVIDVKKSSSMKLVFPFKNAASTTPERLRRQKSVPLLNTYSVSPTRLLDSTSAAVVDVFRVIEVLATLDAEAKVTTFVVVQSLLGSSYCPSMLHTVLSPAVRAPNWLVATLN